MIDLRSTLIGLLASATLAAAVAARHWYLRALWWQREYGVACEAIARMGAGEPATKPDGLTDGDVRRLEDYGYWCARMGDE